MPRVRIVFLLFSLCILTLLQVLIHKVGHGRLVIEVLHLVYSSDQLISCGSQLQGTQPSLVRGIILQGSEQGLSTVPKGQHTLTCLVCIFRYHFTHWCSEAVILPRHCPTSLAPWGSNQGIQPCYIISRLVRYISCL